MSAKTAVSIPGTPPAARPYSRGIIANGFLYTSGFGPKDLITGALPDDVVGIDGIEAQTRQALLNLERLLTEAGLTFADVVKSTTHLKHLERDFPGYDKVYAEFFPEPYPVRTTVGSDLVGMLVEIDVVAVLPEGHPQA
jgi:enamine deaminase RidA (YjgF/YER057c/UK114 family)